MNQAGWTFCANCGSPAAMAGGMPPAGGTLTPPPAYPAYPGYGYGASPWEAERQKQINRTKTGLLLLLIGGLLSWVPFIGLLGSLLLLIGAIFVILGRKAFGAGHSRNVVLAIVVFFVAIISGVVLAVALFVSVVPVGNPDPATFAAQVANALSNLLLGLIVVAAIGGIASVLFTYALQEKTGKILLWAGYAANIAIAIAVWAILSPIITNAIAQSSSGGTYDPAPFIAAQSQITALGILSVIPSLLFAAATYLAWSRVNRGEIPAPSVPPGMPPGMPTMTPPGGASPPM